MKPLKGGHLGKVGRYWIYLQLAILEVVSEKADGYNGLNVVSTGGFWY
jgi:hypothetical protein